MAGRAIRLELPLVWDRIWGGEQREGIPFLPLFTFPLQDGRREKGEERDQTWKGRQWR